MQMAGWGLAHVAVMCYYFWFLRGTQPGALGHCGGGRSLLSASHCGHFSLLPCS